MPTGKGDIENPNAWSGGTPTLSTGTPAPQPGPQGDIPSILTWESQAPSLEVSGSASSGPKGDIGDVYGSPDLSSQDPNVSGLIAWATETPTLDTGSVAAPAGYGDVSDIIYDGDETSAGLSTWQPQPPSLGLGSIGLAAAQGDIPDEWTWQSETPSLGVGTLPAVTGHGDVMDPQAWASGLILTGYVTHTPSPGIVLNWNQVFYLPNPLAVYEIYRSDNGGAFSLLGTVDRSTLTYFDSSVVSFHEYQYYVIANWENSTEQSNTVEFGPTTYLYLVDGTYAQSALAYKVQATVIGAGAGGGSGNGNNVGQGSDYTPVGAVGGNGGAYAQAVYLATALSATEAVTVGTGGAGGASTYIPTAITVAVVNGASGVASAFGSHITANGGTAAINAVVPNAATATVNGGSSVTTEKGGVGGAAGNVTEWLATRYGGSTTLAGAGGAGSQVSASASTNPAYSSPGTVQDGGSSGTGEGGIGSAGAFTPTSGTAATAPAAQAGTAGTGIVGGGGGGGGGFAGFYSSSGLAHGCIITASAGGNGGGYGAGGGAGGCIMTEQQVNPLTVATTGAGGNGANGVVQVIESQW